MPDEKNNEHVEGSGQSTGIKRKQPASAIFESESPVGQPEGYECGMCDETFTLYDKRMRHSETVHAGTHFDCKYCKFPFPSLTTLYTHMNIHTKTAVSKRFKCNLCYSGFSDNQKLRKHMVIIHDGRRSSLKKLKTELENKDKRDGSPKNALNSTSPDSPLIKIEEVLLTTRSHEGRTKIYLPRPTETETDPFAKFQCVQCPEHFENADALIAHTAESHATKSEPEPEVLAESSSPPVIFNPFCIYINKGLNPEPEAQLTSSEL